MEYSAVDVKGPLAKIAVPKFCVNCGGAGTHPVPIQRVEVLEDDSESSARHYRVESLRAWVCPACAQRHAAEAPPMDGWRLLWSYLNSWSVIPLAGSGLLASLVAPKALRPLLSGNPGGALGPGIVLVFLLLVLTVSLVATARGTAHRRAQRPTSVTGALEYSGNLGKMFEPEWRRFRLRNEDFGLRFKAMNASRLWSQRGEEALRAARYRRLALHAAVLVGLIAAAVAVAFWIEPELGRRVRRWFGVE